MLKKSGMTLALFLGAMIMATGVRAESKDDKNPLKGIKCMMCKMPVSEQTAADYKGGKVYFGCAGCVDEFKKNTAKYAAAANAQLVATKQARQRACPMMGKPCKKDVTAKVAGVTVAFCCARCKSSVAKLDEKAQIAKIFGEDGFKKGFEIVKKD